MATAKQWQEYLKLLKTNFTKLARLEFLQPDGSVAFAIDNNAFNRRAGAFIQEGSVTTNLQNGARRTASVTLANLDNEYSYNVNKVWFGQQIRLDMGLSLSDGTEFYLPQGVFYIKNPQEVYAPAKKTVTYELIDKWAYLDGSLFGNLEGIHEVPINSNIFSVISSVLAQDRGNGTVIDSAPPIFTNYYNDKTTTLPDGSTLAYYLTPYTYRCDSGTYADVVLAMNTMLAGWIGYDQAGVLRLDPSQDDVSDFDKPIMWRFDPADAQFLGASYTVNNTEVYNDIIVEGEALDNYAQAKGRATNNAAGSDTSIYSSLGKRTLRLSSSGFYSNQQCADLALFRLKQYSILTKSVSITSTQMFHLTENRLVTIRRRDKDGEPVERHLVTGFTVPIGQTGEMTIQATSVNDLNLYANVEPSLMYYWTQSYAVYTNSQYFWDKYNVNSSGGSYSYNSGGETKVGSVVPYPSLADYSGATSFSFNSATGEFSLSSNTSSLMYASTIYTLSGNTLSAYTYTDLDYPNPVDTYDVYKKDYTASYNPTSVTRGSLVGTVSSGAENAYPQNGVLGDYWYVFANSTGAYTRGADISQVSSADPSAHNTVSGGARESNGYWYTYLGTGG